MSEKKKSYSFYVGKKVPESVTDEIDRGIEEYGSFRDFVLALMEGKQDRTRIEGDDIDSKGTFRENRANIHDSEENGVKSDDSKPDNADSMPLSLHDAKIIAKNIASMMIKTGKEEIARLDAIDGKIDAMMGSRFDTGESSHARNDDIDDESDGATADAMHGKDETVDADALSEKTDDNVYEEQDAYIDDNAVSGLASLFDGGHIEGEDEDEHTVYQETRIETDESFFAENNDPGMEDEELAEPLEDDIDNDAINIEPVDSSDDYLSYVDSSDTDIDDDLVRGLRLILS